MYTTFSAHPIRLYQSRRRVEIFAISFFELSQNGCVLLFLERNIQALAVVTEQSFWKPIIMSYIDRQEMKKRQVKHVVLGSFYLDNQMFCSRPFCPLFIAVIVRIRLHPTHKDSPLPGNSFHREIKMQLSPYIYIYIITSGQSETNRTPWMIMATHTESERHNAEIKYAVLI